MEEKVLIKSEQYSVKKLCRILIIIGAVISLLMFASYVITNIEQYEHFYEVYSDHQEDGYCYSRWETCYACREMQQKPSVVGFGIKRTFEHDWYFLLPFAALILIGGLIYLWLHSYDLTVTDKRIYGRIAWGKRVDLPVDSISATATIPLLKGVSVSTSSGKISFLIIKNANEIYKVFSDLLIERQQETSKATGNIIMQTSDEADQLKKYKELLDSGVISQEEFDAKKKQLLGL